MDRWIDREIDREIHRHLGSIQPICNYCISTVVCSNVFFHKLEELSLANLYKQLLYEKCIIISKNTLDL